MLFRSNWLLCLELYAKLNQLGSKNKYINSNIKLKFYKTNMNSNIKLQIDYITCKQKTQKKRKETIVAKYTNKIVIKRH